MTKTNWPKAFFASMILVFSGFTAATAQSSIPMTAMAAKPAAKAPQAGTDKVSKNPEAQKKYAEGQEAESKNEFAAAVASYKAVIGIDPESRAAHESLIRSSIYAKFLEEDSSVPLPGMGGKTQGATGMKSRAMPIGGGPATEELTKFYQELLKQNPNSPAVHWAAGYVVVVRNKPEAENHFRKALSLDANFAPAYRGLATLASNRNDPNANRDLLRKASEAAPDDPGYASDYARSLKSAGEKEAYRKALEKIVMKFPKDREAMFALLSLAEDADSEVEKMNYMEKAYLGFPDEDTLSFDFTMKRLFTLYTRHAPEKAVPFAEAMSRSFPKDQDWLAMIEHQKAVNQARSLIKQKNFAEAAALLGKAPEPWGVDLTPFYLVKAEAEGAGDTQRSYDTLMAVSAKEPNQPLEKALLHYGEKLGKNKQQVEDDLWQTRVSKAVKLKEFQLVRHDNGQSVNLSDYRGRVILVSFWFPGCGPCLAEFPYIQAALNKYRPQGFEVLLINILPKEDHLAVSTLTDRKNDFISLKIPAEKWAQTEYGVTGTPVNYLLDEEGRIIFRPRVDNFAGQRLLETEIEMLLSRRSKTAKR